MRTILLNITEYTRIVFMILLYIDIENIQIMKSATLTPFLCPLNCLPFSLFSTKCLMKISFCGALIIFPIFTQKAVLICFLFRLQSQVSCHGRQDPSKNDDIPVHGSNVWNPRKLFPFEFPIHPKDHKALEQNWKGCKIGPKSHQKNLLSGTMPKY